MFVLATMLLDRLRSFRRDELAQDAFEYVLVIGVVVVAVLVAVMTPVGNDLATAIVGGVCNSVRDNITYVTFTCP